MQKTFTITRTSQAEFNATLRRYLKYNRRTLPESLNEKGYFIAKEAIYQTHKADHERIKKELGAEMSPIIGKRGKATKKKKLALLEKYWAQLSVLIIIARLRKAKKQIPSASELKEMALKMVRSRIISVGFIRSGWLSALRKLARFSKYGEIKFELPKKTGVFKGGASPATSSQGNLAKCVIWNSAGGEKKHKNALIRYGQPALELAVTLETKSMKDYIEKKLRESAQKAGIKTN